MIFVPVVAQSESVACHCAGLRLLRVRRHGTDELRHPGAERQTRGQQVPHRQACAGACAYLALRPAAGLSPRSCGWAAAAAAAWQLLCAGSPIFSQLTCVARQRFSSGCLPTTCWWQQQQQQEPVGRGISRQRVCMAAVAKSSAQPGTSRAEQAADWRGAIGAASTQQQHCVAQSACQQGSRSSKAHVLHMQRLPRLHNCAVGGRWYHHY